MQLLYLVLHLLRILVYYLLLHVLTPSRCDIVTKGINATNRQQHYNLQTSFTQQYLQNSTHVYDSLLFTQLHRYLERLTVSRNCLKEIKVAAITMSSCFPDRLLAPDALSKFLPIRHITMLNTRPNLITSSVQYSANQFSLRLST